ncbi:MAG TPA: antibiotic biosynthesis monooxygenase [Draconibacterium sp.]|nr:antibiotic biosynthesis monooxygenase [Draconibacterium sp.]
MKEIQVTAKFKIHKGKVDEFKKVVTNIIDAVAKNEKGKGALQYDWFFSPDDAECVAHETYTDSNAVMAHMGNAGELLGQLLAMSDFELEVYGNPSKELQNAAAGLNPKVYFFYKGL